MKPVEGNKKKRRKEPKFAPTIDHPHLGISLINGAESRHFFLLIYLISHILVFVPYDIDAHVYYRKFPEKLAGRVNEPQDLVIDS